jgi:two-component system sensor histidine kinase ChvG
LRSRIARSIFIGNFTGVAILCAGVLLLAEMRAQLVQAKIDSLTVQGEVVANVLAEAATVGDPEPQLIDQRARAVMRRLVLPRSTRVRLYTVEGDLVADTDILSDRIVTRVLPELDDEATDRSQNIVTRAWRKFWRMAEKVRLLPWRQDHTLEQERAQAAQGAISIGQRRGETGEPVVSVSLPVQRVEAVIGVLTLESGDVDAIVAAERRAMTPFIVSAVLVALLSSLFLSVQIARPLRRLADAADRLRRSGATRLELPDIRRRKDEIGDLADALERMTGSLAERIDANERFAAEVAHEIKNPLTSIRSAVETTRAVSDPVVREKLLGVIAADASRLDRLITDMQRATHLEAETARAAPARIDMVKFLMELTETYALTRAENEAKVVFASLSGAGVKVFGHEGPLGQVFRNLIDNAVSFSPAGGVVTVRVDTDGRRGERVVRAEVLDQGPGIPDPNLERIFERFYTDRPRGQQSGRAAFGGNSGLGLAIARQIVDAHKGRIWAENIHGGGGRTPQGARFVVELPTVDP